MEKNGNHRVLNSGYCEFCSQRRGHDSQFEIRRWSRCDIVLSRVIVSTLSVSVSASARDKTRSLSQVLNLLCSSFPRTKVRPVNLFILLVRVHVVSEKAQR